MEDVSDGVRAVGEGHVQPWRGAERASCRKELLGADYWQTLDVDCATR